MSRWANAVANLPDQAPEQPAAQPQQGRWSTLAQQQIRQAEMQRHPVYGTPPPIAAAPAPTTSGQAIARFQTQEQTPAPAGFITSMRAGTVEDPMTQIGIFAEQRFPHLRKREREDRYRVDPETNEVLYRGDDNKIYREVGGVGARIANILGKYGLPTAGGALGIAGGPLTMAVGGMGGLAAQKLYAGQVEGEPQTALGNLADMGLQGAIDYGIAKGGGALAEKLVTRNAIPRVDTVNRAAADILISKAARMGIRITPAEATGLAALVNQQTRLGAGMDDAASKVMEFYRSRGGDVERAIREFTESPMSMDQAGAAVRNVSKGVIDDAQAAVTSASRPAYRLAVDQRNLVPERPFYEMQSDPVIGPYLSRVKEAPLYKVSDAPENSTAVIDAAGKMMRDEALTLPQGSYQREVLEESRKRLLRKMEEVYPGYYDARRSQAMMRETHLDPLKEGIEGVYAKTKDTALQGIPDRLLASKNVSPASVAMWRKQFENQGMLEDWDKLVGAWLRQQWETVRISRQAPGDMRGVNFRDKVFGNEARRKVLREALGQQKYRNFSDLMEVLDAVGRVPRGQSMTEPAQQQGKRDLRDSSPIMSVVRDIDFTQPGKVIANWWQERKLDLWRDDLATVITSPEAMRELEKMGKFRKMPANARRKVEVALLALYKAGVIRRDYAAQEPEEGAEGRQYQQP